MTLSEQETTITMTGDCDVVTIWSSQPHIIRRLAKRKNAKLVTSGTYKDGSEWASYAVDKDQFDIEMAVRNKGGDGTKRVLPPDHPFLNRTPKD